jgi:hypothetical protein
MIFGLGSAEAVEDAGWGEVGLGSGSLLAGGAGSGGGGVCGISCVVNGLGGGVEGLGSGSFPARLEAFHFMSMLKERAIWRS